MATKSQASLDLKALHNLKSTEPAVWLAPSEKLSDTARQASKQLFAFLRTYCTKSPLDELLTDKDFDAEQIWQQIDLQSQPLVSKLKREVKKLEKNPEDIGKIKKVLEGERSVVEEESDGFDEELGGSSGEELEDGFDDEEEKQEEIEGESESEGMEMGEEEEEEDGYGEEEEKGEVGIEDEFFKINELEKYLEEDEAREYGSNKDDNKNVRNKKGRKVLVDKDEEDGEGDEDEDEEDEDEEDEELGDFDDEDEDEDKKFENSRYEDFFGAKKKNIPLKKSKVIYGSEEDTGSDDEEEDDEEGGEHENSGNLSTHEKQLKKLRSEIEKMEKANLDPKTWTMQGEVTAAQRPKNSALEVDLDFQHNLRPAPVITEEFTESLEEMIKKRILEGQFDDVIKIPNLPTKAPKELKELDDNKSKKGLAEIYEEEYVKTTNPAATPLSFSDEQKKEASMLFKKLCLKLDALSHFNFTPKPVIEDLSVQANVPALAMEEVAPVAVSDAAMLAPEEVFAGKGDVKEEAELTKEERKRRRANKKRKFKAKAAKRTEKKARHNILLNQSDGKEEQ